MKKQVIIATIAALAIFAMACGKSEKAAINDNSNMTTENQQWKTMGATEISLNEIDPGVKRFVETNFPKTVILNCHKKQQSYTVKLEDQTCINFDSTFVWIKVKCKNSTIYNAVPSSVVPSHIADYLTSRFPDNHICEIEKTHYGWEIEMDNNQEIRFGTDLNLIEGGKNYLDNPEIKAFVKSHFPLADIRLAQQFDNKIEVKLTDNTELAFDLDLNWTDIDCEDATIYKCVPTQFVCRSLEDFITSYFPYEQVVEVEKRTDGSWEIELSNTFEFKFDKDFNLIEFDNKTE